MTEDKCLATLRNFRLIDDVFFSACFDNNERDVEYILRIILDKPNLTVLKVQTQKSVENIYGRSVRFDVFASDDSGKLYNIEVQRTDAGAVPSRARFNSSLLDYHHLKKQAKFSELPETFVIFITEHDVLKGEKQIYHVNRIIRETGEDFGDGTHIIYVNASYRKNDGSALSNLIHDFFCANPADMKHRQLAKRVSFLKNNKHGVRKMSSIIREIFRQEIEEASAEVAAEVATKVATEVATETERNTLLGNIRNLMETMKWTATQAMDALKLSADKQKELLNFI